MCGRGACAVPAVLEMLAVNASAAADTGTPGWLPVLGFEIDSAGADPAVGVCAVGADTGGAESGDAMSVTGFRGTVAATASLKEFGAALVGVVGVAPPVVEAGMLA
jgi:hypothetical protein